MNIGTVIDDAAAGDPARAALIVNRQTISYSELGAAVERCAARLADGGLAGRRVAVVDVGSLVSIAAMLGAARIGAAAALMNPALTPQELNGIATSAGCASTGIAGTKYVDRLRDAGVSETLTATELFDNEAASPVPADDVDDRDGLVLFTSGTTGLPKAIGITQGRLGARITAVANRFRPDIGPTVSMMTVPFFHVGGAIGVLGNLYAGNTYVVQDRFDAANGCGWCRSTASRRRSWCRRCCSASWTIPISAAPI
jgi:long-chain acyl-CoA synthetase